MVLAEKELAMIKTAIETIAQGICKRMDVNSRIKVYEVKDTVRVDIKVR